MRYHRGLARPPMDDSPGESARPQQAEPRRKQTQAASHGGSAASIVLAGPDIIRDSKGSTREPQCLRNGNNCRRRPSECQAERACNQSRSAAVGGCSTPESAGCRAHRQRSSGPVTGKGGPASGQALGRQVQRPPRRTWRGSPCASSSMMPVEIERGPRPVSLP